MTAPSKSRGGIVAIVIGAAVVLLAAAAAILFDWSPGSGTTEHTSPEKRTETAPANLENRGSASREARESRPIAPPAADWTVRTVNEAGESVADAIIYISAEDQQSEIGRTDARGELASAKLAADVTILATHAQYAAQSARIADSKDRISVITLHPGATLRGRAAFNGVGIGGVRVLAAPMQHLLNVNDVERALGGDPRFPVVKTSVDGAFAIPGLDPQLLYLVLAGGNGYGIEFPKTNVTIASADRLELAVLPVYGLAVKTRDENGAPLVASRELVPFPSVGAMLPAGSATSVVATSGPLRRMYGVPLELILESCDLEPLVIFRSKVETENYGPVRIALTCPGYKNASLELLLPRVKDAITIKTIPLARAAAGFANVTIELKDFPAPPNATFDRRKMRRPIGEIEFRAAEGGGFASPSPAGFNAPVWSLEQSRAVIAGVPFGNYEVRFSAETGFHCGKAQPVTIQRSDETISISVVPDDSTDVGGLLVKVKDAQGKEYTGPLDVQLSQGRGPRRSDARFVGAPYLLEFLPAKQIHVAVIPHRAKLINNKPEQFEADVTIPSRAQAVHEITLKD